MYRLLKLQKCSTAKFPLQNGKKQVLATPEAPEIFGFYSRPTELRLNKTVALRLKSLSESAGRLNKTSEAYSFRLFLPSFLEPRGPTKSESLVTEIEFKNQGIKSTIGVNSLLVKKFTPVYILIYNLSEQSFAIIRHALREQ